MTREDALLLAELKAESNQGSVYFRTGYVVKQGKTEVEVGIIRRSWKYGRRGLIENGYSSSNRSSHGKVGNLTNSSVSQRASTL